MWCVHAFCCNVARLTFQQCYPQQLCGSLLSRVTCKSCCRSRIACHMILLMQVWSRYIGIKAWTTLLVILIFLLFNCPNRLPNVCNWYQFSKAILSWICDGMRYWYLGHHSTGTTSHEITALLDLCKEKLSTKRDVSPPWRRWFADKMWGQARKSLARNNCFLGAQSALLEKGAVLEKQAAHACLVPPGKQHVYLKYSSLAGQRSTVMKRRPWA